MLYLIRHPKPEVSAGLCYGQLDVPVSAAVQEVAFERLLPQLSEMRPARLFSSPLQRCRHLAEQFSERMGVPVTFDRRLQEIHFGDWEGVSWDDVPRDELDAWAADVAGYRPPGGESVNDLAKRVMDWAAEIDQTDEVVLAVTHAGVIRALLGCRQGLPVSDWVNLSVGFASVVDVLRYEGISC